MISKIGVENRNINTVRSTAPSSKGNQTPSFKGGAWALLLQGIQECEKNPMINVAVIDLLSAILPRTIVESMTNWFAGFEAFRRESSGLIVNCLIPGVITMGIANALNKFIMPKGANLSSCWADSSLVDHLSELYTKSNSNNKVKDSFKEIIKNIEGVDGKNTYTFKNLLTEEELNRFAQELENLTNSTKKGKEVSKDVKKLTQEIVEKTHIFENVQVKNGQNTVKASTVNTLLDDTVKFFREYKKVGNSTNMADFAKKSKQLVKSKSFIGLAVILPLAASMQYINRWITEKVSGVKGAPIYDDFGKENAVKDEKSKEGLLKQKLISISSMIGVSLLSMMKLPTASMLEFKGIFPTMDQARIISTTTFCSRMAVADDKNELAEATWRDIATFCGLYFFGDYAAKGAATIIQNKTGVELLNDTKPLKGDENFIKKMWHWIKDVNTKSSEEVVSKTARELEKQGLKPTTAQAETIKKEIKRAVNLRSACQVTNLGVSLVLLGLIVPIFTRRNTKKKHAEALKQAQQTSSSGVNDVGGKDGTQNSTTKASPKLATATA